MIKTKLAMAVAGVALSAGASTASAHVMYNTFTTAAASDTDGWTYTYDGSDANTVATGPESGGYQGTQVPWLGTAGGALPFGYAGRVHLNWAAAIHGPGTLKVSAADALADYGVAAEIDTGAGAWKDNGLGLDGLPTATGPTGWKHQTDIGLIKSDISTLLRLNLTTLGTVSGNFGVTVFKGMDTTNSVAYSHHGSWNNVGKPETTSNPFFSTGVGSGMEYLTHDATVDAVNYLEFFAEAGQVYTIALGGNSTAGRWNANVSGYELSIAAVPVPGAVWLFGSAMAGIVGFGGRRKTAVAA